MIAELIKDTEEKMRKAIEAVKQDFSQVRTGRANPGLVEHLKLEAYGAQMSVNQVAAVSVPEPRQLLIAPFDRTLLSVIEKAIQKSDLGINPTNDGVALRLTIPQLNEQRRKDLIKQVHQKAEHGRVSIRTVRQEVQKKLQTARKNSEISEDEERRTHEQIQKLVDRYIAQVDELLKIKEAELMEV